MKQRLRQLQTLQRQRHLQPPQLRRRHPWRKTVRHFAAWRVPALWRTFRANILRGVWVTAGCCHATSADFGVHTERSYEILEQTLSVVSLANPLVAAIQLKDRDAEEWSKDHDLASQVRRALSSVGLNVAETAHEITGLNGVK